MVSAKYDPAKSSLVFLNDVIAVKPPDVSDSLTESICYYVLRRTLAQRKSQGSYVPRKGGGHDPCPLGRDRVFKGRRVQYLKVPNVFKYGWDRKQ